jgi:PAS domain S-box-containing protein
MPLHSLLRHQIERSLGGVDTGVEPWRSFLKVVDEAYHAFDRDRTMIERSMDLSSAELIAANNRLRESEERYALVARASNDGLWDWKLPTNEVYFSTRWKATLGYDDDEISSSPSEWFDRIHPQDRASVERDIGLHLAGQILFFENEHRMRHRNGTFRWVMTRGLAVRNSEGVPVRFAGSQADITEGKVVDALTGLPNRMLLIDRLSRRLDRQRRQGGPQFAVLFLDLDGFKLVNDSLGHVVGDELLQLVARRLEGSLRPNDRITRALDVVGMPADEHTLARTGGDEFIILLDSVRDVLDATRVADRIQQALSQPFVTSGRSVFSSASIGIAMSGSGYVQAEDMLRDADTAMYRAKARGKGRSEVFDAEMRVQLLERLQLDTSVRLGIQRHEFLPYFQPIIDLRSGRLSAFEALLRWRHPERGIVTPSEFVPLLEENGLVVPVGKRFLSDVCQQLRNWQDSLGGAARLRINVNFASQQFLEPGLPARLLDALKEANLQPGHLVVEITESSAIKDLSRTIDVLRQLQDAGIGVVLDDFGTGYSSLAWLHQLPINGFKLDPSFIAGGRRRPEILQAVFALARAFDLTVTAEGIETHEQCDRLRDLGCDFAQGYAFSYPLDADQAADAISADRMWLPNIAFAG